MNAYIEERSELFRNCTGACGEAEFIDNYENTGFIPEQSNK